MPNTPPQPHSPTPAREAPAAPALESVTGVQLARGIGHRPARGFWADAWAQVFRQPVAVAGLVFIALVVLAAVFAPLIASGHPILIGPADGPTGHVSGPSPLATLAQHLPATLLSPAGLHLAGFTAVWTIAWCLAPAALPGWARLLTGVIPFSLFAARVFAAFFTDVPAGDPLGDALRPFTTFVSTAPAYQVLVDLGVLVGLFWFAGVFAIPRATRVALAWLIPVVGLGGLISQTAHAVNLTSPLVRYLSAADVLLFLAAFAALALLLPPAPMKRGPRALMLAFALGQAAATMALARTAHAALVWLGNAHVIPDISRAPGLVPAVVLLSSAAAALALLRVAPATTPRGRLLLVGLTAVFTGAITQARWADPLERFDYLERQAAGEIVATYTLVPFSPTQGSTSLDHLPPGATAWHAVITEITRPALAADASAEPAAPAPAAEGLLTDDTRRAALRRLRRLEGVVQQPIAPIVERFTAAADAGQLRTPADAVAFFAALPADRHLLGTDSLGQDVLSQMLHAARLSVSIGLVSTGLSVLIGVTLGALMGYFGGLIELLLYRAVEVFMSIPLLFLLIVAAGVLPRNTYVMMIVIGCVTWTSAARFTRAEFLRLREMDFVQAARAAGLPVSSILFKHMLPNGVTPVLVDASFRIATAILIEATLSFLGLGPANQASWGKLLRDATADTGTFQWWLAIFPGAAIFLTVFAYNVLGEALRDAIDPKLKKAKV